jgi:hypothetical protein
VPVGAERTPRRAEYRRRHAHSRQSILFWPQKYTQHHNVVNFMRQKYDMTQKQALKIDEKTFY